MWERTVMIAKKRAILFVASIGLATASSITAWNQPDATPVIPLPSVFEKSSTPPGALVKVGTTGRQQPLLSLDPAFVSEKDAAYFAFRAQENVSVPCSRSLAVGCCTFSPSDAYQVEVSSALRTAALGTPTTTKARWVRVLSDADLGALGVSGLRGTPVVAAFGEEQLVGAQFVALYRRKHWPSGAESHAASCSGHTHMQVTWARLPRTSGNAVD
jgi:hypothetical protein